MHPNREQWDTTSTVHLGQVFFKMDLVVSMSFKEECHVWLGAGSLYLDKPSKEA